MSPNSVKLLLQNIKNKELQKPPLLFLWFVSLEHFEILTFAYTRIYSLYIKDLTFLFLIAFKTLSMIEVERMKKYNN